MEDFKNNKVLPIVKQFTAGGDRYEINGIDLSKAIFFYKVENEKFKLIPSGSYTVTITGGNTYLTILDSDIISGAIEYQICYEFTLKSSSYDDDFPDIAILKEKYNEVVEDLKTMVLTFGKQGFNLDDINGVSVLPKLEENTFWVMEEGEPKLKSLKYLDDEFSKQVINLNSHTESKKKEIDNHATGIKNIVTIEGEKQKTEVTVRGDQVKGSLEQYLITAENGGNAEFVQGYSPLNFNRVEPTISALVNSAGNKYKLGDVVEVLGYYEAGDGAGHKRKACNADDGSGVLGANGLWWNIIDKADRFKGKKLCLIGDSITALSGASIWKDYIKNTLGLSEIVSMAVSGSTIATNIPDRNYNFQQQVDSAPVADFYWIWGGVNDYVANSPLGQPNSINTDELCGSIQFIIAKLQKKNKNAEIFFCTPLRQFWDNSNGLNANDAGLTIEDYAEAILDTCNTRGVPVLNLNSVCNFNEWNYGQYLPDGVHPNEAGYKRFMYLFRDFMLNPSSCVSSRGFYNVSTDTKKTVIAKSIEGNASKVYDIISVNKSKTDSVVAMHVGDPKQEETKTSLAMHTNGATGIIEATKNGSLIDFNFIGNMLKNGVELCTSKVNVNGSSGVVDIGNLKIQYGQLFVNTTKTPISLVNSNVSSPIFASISPVGFDTLLTANLTGVTPSSFSAMASVNNTACFWIYITLNS